MSSRSSTGTPSPAHSPMSTSTASTTTAATAAFQSGGLINPALALEDFPFPPDVVTLLDRQDDALRAEKLQALNIRDFLSLPIGTRGKRRHAMAEKPKSSKRPACQAPVEKAPPRIRHRLASQEASSLGEETAAGIEVDEEGCSIPLATTTQTPFDESPERVVVSDLRSGRVEMRDPTTPTPSMARKNPEHVTRLLNEFVLAGESRMAADVPLEEMAARVLQVEMFSYFCTSSADWHLTY